jgi:hypothetical protein
LAICDWQLREAISLDYSEAASFAGEAVSFPYGAGATENVEVGNRYFFAIFCQLVGEVAEWSKAALC